MLSRCQVHASTADQGSADVTGRQARDRPPKGVINRPNCDIALGAAIAPLATTETLHNGVDLV
ncbi:MAG: hypothetical protein ACKO21_12250 [Nodosilinea sp.]